MLSNTHCYGGVAQRRSSLLDKVAPILGGQVHRSKERCLKEQLNGLMMLKVLVLSSRITVMMSLFIILLSRLKDLNLCKKVFG